MGVVLEGIALNTRATVDAGSLHYARLSRLGRSRWKKGGLLPKVKGWNLEGGRGVGCVDHVIMLMMSGFGYCEMVLNASGGFIEMEYFGDLRSPFQ